MRLLKRWRARRASRTLRRELLFLGTDVASWTDEELAAAALELGRIAERSCFTVEEATKAFALLGAACRQASAFGTSLEAASGEIAQAITPARTREVERRLLEHHSDKPPCVPEDTRNQNCKNEGTLEEAVPKSWLEHLGDRDGEGLGTIGPIPNSDPGPLLERLAQIDEKHHGDLPGYLSPGLYDDEEGER